MSVFTKVALVGVVFFWSLAFVYLCTYEDFGKHRACIDKEHAMHNITYAKAYAKCVKD